MPHQEEARKDDVEVISEVSANADDAIDCEETSKVRIDEDRVREELQRLRRSQPVDIEPTRHPLIPSSCNNCFLRCSTQTTNKQLTNNIHWGARHFSSSSLDS